MCIRSLIHWSRDGSEKTKRAQRLAKKIEINRNSHISFKRENNYRRCINKRLLRVWSHLGNRETKSHLKNSIRKTKAKITT